MIGAEGYLTSSPPIKVGIRERLEDFIVEEIPILFPSRETCALIEKRGLSTNAAVRKLASHFKIRRREITYAGMKDSRAITRQWISLPISPHQLKNLNLGNLKVLQTKKGSVRFGQLEGNRFSIRLRCDTSYADQISETLNELKQRGVPDFFGWQRFGSVRPNTHLVGWAAIEKEYEKAVDLYVGNPHPNENEEVREARALFDSGNLSGALALFPHYFVYEREMLKALINGKSFKEAYQTLPEKMEMLMVGAAQAEVFNKIVSFRLPHTDEIWEGDLVKSRHRLFFAKNADDWTEKAKTFQVSATAPFGSCRFAQNSQGELEKKLASKLPKGFRRTVRFQIKDINVRLDDGIVVEFTIPKGRYATAVIRELTKWEEK